MNFKRQTFGQHCREANDVFVILCLQVPGEQLSDAGACGGAKGHDVSPCPVDCHLGNTVLGTTKDRSQVLEGDGAEELNVDDLTATLVWISKMQKSKMNGWKENECRDHKESN